MPIANFGELRYDEVHRHLTSAAWAKRQRTLLSRPTPRRRTSITITALPFMVCLGPGGATTVTFDSAGRAREEAEVG
jgi:hypothetical protein